MEQLGGTYAHPMKEHRIRMLCTDIALGKVLVLLISIMVSIHKLCNRLKLMPAYKCEMTTT